MIRRLALTHFLCLSVDGHYKYESMINTVVDYFSRFLQSRKIASGQISFEINLSDVREITFRVDSGRVWIDWGDGTNNGWRNLAFNVYWHRYAAPGTYQIVMRGDNITDLEMSNCHMTRLDLSQCVTLEYINCSHNSLKELDVSSCGQLYELYCAKNQIRKFELGCCNKLLYLSCSYNYIEHLDVKQCPNLTHLRCRYNLLHHIEIGRNRKLVFFNIEKNAFKFSELLTLFSMLPRHSSKNIGVITLLGNAENDSYDPRQVYKCLFRRGWREM